MAAGRAMYGELCELLRSAGYEIRVERFKSPSRSGGGMCRIAEKRLILLDETAHEGERSRALLEVVEQLGLEHLGRSGADLSPALLAQLNRRGRMPWPHKSRAPGVARAQSREEDGVRARGAVRTRDALPSNDGLRDDEER